MTKVNILISAMLMFTISGCVVSKKKYEAAILENSELNKGLNSAITTNDSLENRIDKMIAEFEEMKNELHLSNAVKSDDISELLVKVTQFSDLNTKLQSKLDETLNLYKSQRQNTQSVSSELKNLKLDNQKLKRDTAGIKYALKLSKERFIQLEKELDIQKNKYTEAISSKQKATQELSVNKQKLNSFEQQLIQNKEKMENISNAFIQLRKEMLSAKSTNTIIDPNKNKNIDTIAKELGHY